MSDFRSVNTVCVAAVILAAGMNSGRAVDRQNQSSRFQSRREVTGNSQPLNLNAIRSCRQIPHS